MPRPSFDQYFMGIAHATAARATCLRKHVGAVLVTNGMIVSTGYNGPIRGQPHCDDRDENGEVLGCLMEDGHCVRTVHAEANAIIQAARNGVSTNAGTLYTTASPCWPCFKLIANAGIIRIAYGEIYRDERITEYAKKAGIFLIGPMP